MNWEAMRERRMAEPGAAKAYEAARRAFESEQAARQLSGREEPRPEAGAGGL